jgi:FkbM family methyltransferase
LQDDQIIETELFSLAGRIRLAGYAGDSYYRQVTTVPGTDLDVLTMMDLLLAPGGVMIDVGANIGLETISGARAVGPSGTVLSFEPSPQNVQLLRRNIELNDVGKTVRVHPFGLSDVAAGHLLQYSADNRGGAFLADVEHREISGQTETVETRVLDQISGGLLDGGPVERCDLIKVDIEGHEPHFLRGAQQFIATLAPACILEVNHWCLNAFTRVTLPDYLDQVFDMFPYVYAFDHGEIVDVRDRQIYFMHENIVRMHLVNLYCDSDRSRARDTVARYHRFTQADRAYSGVLEQRVAELSADNQRLQVELAAIKGTRGHRAIGRANQLIRR